MSISLNGDGIISGVSTLTNPSEITVGTGASVFSPATNTLALGTNGSERARINSSGNVGIGTDNPSKPLQVHSDSSSAVLITGATPQLRFNSNVGDGSDNDRVILGRASGNDQFISGSVDGDAILRSATSKKVIIGYGTTEIAQFNSSGLKFKTSGMGIDFSATSGTGTSELFDDYEEGTFNPNVVMQISGSVTLNSSYNTLNYTKVGQLVTISGQIRIDSVSSPTGVMWITNLPFTVKSTGQLGRSGGSLYYFDNSAGSGQYSTKPVLWMTEESITRLYIFTTWSDGGFPPGPADEISFNCTYVAA